MKLFGYVIQKTGNNGNSLTDDARKEGLAVREMNAEKRRTLHEIEMARMQLELARVQDKLSQYEDDDEDDGDMFDVLAQKAMTSILGGGTSPPSQTPPTVTVTDDAAIEDIIKSVPENYRKMAKGLDDATIKKFLKSRTQYDDDTIERAIKVFRTKNL
jgi:hypothetical protein